MKEKIQRDNDYKNQNIFRDVFLNNAPCMTLLWGLYSFLKFTEAYEDEEHSIVEIIENLVTLFLGFFQIKDA